MKFKIILMFAVLAILLLLPSCIKMQQIEITCEQFNQNPNATSEFQATVNQMIIVKLCSNPTTGFQWKYEIIGQNVLQETDHRLVSVKNENVVGAPDKEVWNFQAVGKGTAEVRMEYGRQWEGGEQNEWTYVFTVTVE